MLALARLGYVICCVLVVVCGLGAHLVARHKCDMDKNLFDLLMYTTDQLESLKVPFWLDYGTLLGIVRDKKILPWEFDNDMGTFEQHCDTVLALREKFMTEKGFKMYGRNEFIPEKAKWGYDGTISMPCVRVYHTDPSQSLDLYWYKTVTVADLAKEDVIYPPPGYEPSRDGDLICNYEGWTNDLPGGCRLKTDVLPLKQLPMYGRQFPVLAQSERVLEQMYGSDWMIPRPKGYKAILCPPVWTWGPNLYLFLLVLSLGGAVGLFWYLRIAYIKSITDVRYAPVATNAAAAASSTASGSGTGSDWPCCGDDGCCTRSLFQRCYVWSGAPAAPAAIGGGGTGSAGGGGDAIELDGRSHAV